MTPAVAIIIPTYQDQARLGLLLDSLQLLVTADRPPADVIVVDNGSPVPPHDVVARHPNARLLVEHRRGSYAARNTGAAATGADILAFTDSDCIATPTWLSRALSTLDRRPDLAAVAGRVEVFLTNDSGRPRTAWEWWDWLEGFPQDRYVAAGFGVTANLVVRREAFETVGGFDSDAISGGDRDFGERLSRAGLLIGYDGDAVVRHPARGTRQAVLTKTVRTTRGAARLEHRRGRSSRGFVRYLLRQLKTLARVVVTSARDPRLTTWQARMKYLAAGVVVQLSIISVALREEVRHRLGPAQ